MKIKFLPDKINKEEAKEAKISNIVKEISYLKSGSEKHHFLK